MDKDRTRVHFTEDISLQGLEKILAPYMSRLTGKVGIKVHFGDDTNQYYVKPSIYKDLVLKLNGTFLETNVLYKGKRRITETHIQLAKVHGFDYAPIDILDSEGETEIPFDGKYFNTVHVGNHIDSYDSILVISHFKGHMISGFGGAIKNVGMGMAAIPGKMTQHADSNPKVSPERCVKCGKCTTVCPVDAIKINPLVLDLNICIACGKCIGTCPSGALSVPWGKTGQNGFTERMADYAKAIIANRNMVYINFLTDISPDCDCMGSPRMPFVHDIGILASDDILAVDAASADLVDKTYGKHDAFLHVISASGRYIFDYGTQIGLGNIDYQLIKL